MIRDFCLTIGLHLECRDYSILETNALDSLPFQVEDLINIEPVVKHLDISSEDVQANMEVAQKFLLEGKVKEALEAYQNCIQLLLNVIKNSISFGYN
jgi:hypothetical protein